MESPLVTVICLCHNHDRFVAEAIESVLRQTHPRIQLIVVDDASTDRSVSVIRKELKDRPEVTFLSLLKNLGNCQAFNRGFEISKGEFVIDLSADDVLMPDRVDRGVRALSACGPDYGVNFTDAELIDQESKHLGYHSDRFPHAGVPEGDIYKNVITSYFISSPTMMMRSSVLASLGGYDETLAYEDFDFWIRSSRKFKFCYTAEPLVKRRIVTNSMSANQYKYKSVQLRSTFRVCEKILELNRNQEEKEALRGRLLYEMRKAFQVAEWGLAFRYFKLLRKNRASSFPIISPHDHA
jgi:glycosyltransferase involved in cell wall biosynthesis